MESLTKQIMDLKILNSTYRSKYTSFSSIKGTIKPLTVFAKTDSSALKIKGRLITSGTYKDNTLGEFILPAKELKKSMNRWAGTPIYTTHKIYQDIMTGQNPSVRDVVGKIISVEWNNEDQGIDYYAEVYDKDISEKMLAGLIKYISAGFAREVITEIGPSNKYEYHLKNIEPAESSLVFNPRDPNAEFHPVI